MPTWPLPERKLIIGFRRRPRSNVVRSVVDVGEPQVRRRSTRAIYDVTGTILCDDAELTLLLDWFRDTIFDGSERFDWEDPHDGTAVVMRFIEPPDPTSTTPRGTLVALTLEMFK